MQALAFWKTIAMDQSNLLESGDILALGDPDCLLSDEDTASIAQAIHAVLPFRDRSRRQNRPSGDRADTL